RDLPGAGSPPPPQVQGLWCVRLAGPRSGPCVQCYCPGVPCPGTVTRPETAGSAPPSHCHLTPSPFPALCTSPGTALPGPSPPFPGAFVTSHSSRGPSISPSESAASRIASQADASAGSGLHPPHPSPLATGDEATRGIAVEKFDIVKKWGINTYKCTKQLISERFGRGSRTVDLELETQIELLRDTKRKYECVLQLARALTHHFYSLVQTQHALGDAFSDLSQKSPELQEEFGCNAETQKLLCKNGETLLGAVNFFVSSINTLVNKTMEDTLMTVKQYETAR
ncbi:arfaptin-2-like, partial [Terrapene carolina triunguis]|uniref:arfaptin-2-like n=1 Tax=Terrapene triunguis TaxID=2587831 RepID=UPI000E77F544